MAQGDAEKITIRKIETEKTPSIVSHVAVTETAFNHYLTMLARHNAGFHDLMVLFGPQHQEGPVRLVTDAALVLNPNQNTVFNDVFGAASEALKITREMNPDMGVLGIGTVVGISSDVQTLLGIGGYSLYWAGGDRLYSGIPLRPRMVDNPTQSRIYTLDSNKQPLMIPPNNIYAIPKR